MLEGGVHEISAKVQKILSEPVFCVIIRIKYLTSGVFVFDQIVSVLPNTGKLMVGAQILSCLDTLKKKKRNWNFFFISYQLRYQYWHQSKKKKLQIKQIVCYHSCLLFLVKHIPSNRSNLKQNSQLEVFSVHRQMANARFKYIFKHK